MAGGKIPKAKARIVERRRKALSFRKAGASYRSIALRISAELDLPKYDASQAYDDVAAALAEVTALTRLEAESLRELELERLDVATAAIASQVQAGDLFAVDRWIRISESRRRLLGLDAPIRIEVDRLVDAELEQFLSQLESVLPPDTFRQVLEAVATVGDRANAASAN